MTLPSLTRRAGVPALALSASMLLGGCAALGFGPGGAEPVAVESSSPAGNETAPGVVESNGATPTASEQPQSSENSMGAGDLASDQGGKQAAPTAPMPNVPPYMHPGAGGPLPESAKPAGTFTDSPNGRYALVASPSGNIVCQIASTKDASCLIFKTSFGVKKNPEGKWENEIAIAGTAVPHLAAPQKDPAWFAGGKPQKIPYGQQVHFGGVVCASEVKGMTCWDVTTGRGAFLSKGKVEGF